MEHEQQRMRTDWRYTHRARIIRHLALHQVVEDSRALTREISYKDHFIHIVHHLANHKVLSYSQVTLSTWCLAGCDPVDDVSNSNSLSDSSSANQSNAEEQAWRARIVECIDEKGSPEAQLWRMASPPMPLAVFNEKIGKDELFKGALMEAKKLGWVVVAKSSAPSSPSPPSPAVDASSPSPSPSAKPAKKAKASGGDMIVSRGPDFMESIPEDKVREILAFVRDNGDLCTQGNDIVAAKYGKTVLNELKKRKLIQQSSMTTFRLVPGPHFSPDWLDLPKDITNVELEQHYAKEKDTKENEKDNSSNTLDIRLRPYDLEQRPEPTLHGGLQHLYYTAQEVKSALLEMGFEEQRIVSPVKPTPKITNADRDSYLFGDAIDVHTDKQLRVSLLDQYHYQNTASKQFGILANWKAKPSLKLEMLVGQPRQQPKLTLHDALGIAAMLVSKLGIINVDIQHTTRDVIRFAPMHHCWPLSFGCTIHVKSSSSTVSTQPKPSSSGGTKKRVRRLGADWRCVGKAGLLYPDNPSSSSSSSTSSPSELAHIYCSFDIAALASILTVHPHHHQ